MNDTGSWEPLVLFVISEVLSSFHLYKFSENPWKNKFARVYTSNNSQNPHFSIKSKDFSPKKVFQYYSFLTELDILEIKEKDEFAGAHKHRIHTTGGKSST